MSTPSSPSHRIQSDGTTALGVDNRAGTSVLLHVLRQHVASGRKANFIVVFTVGEELGLYGSKYVDLAPYNVKTCFVFDCSKRPGYYIQSCVGCSLYTATFVGKPSHAAVAPEKGISAIAMAAEAIRRIPHGPVESDHDDQHRHDQRRHRNERRAGALQDRR